MSTAYQHQASVILPVMIIPVPKSNKVRIRGWICKTGRRGCFFCLQFRDGCYSINPLLLFRHGDHLIATKDIYGGTYRIFDHFEKAYNISVTYDECQDISKTERCINENTKAIFLETPTNPLLQEVDIEKYSKLAKKT